MVRRGLSGISPAALAAAVAVAVIPACKPDLEGRESQIAGPRVLAVRSEPAEAPPGAAVTYSALVVDANGEVTSPALDWAYCALPRPVAENDDVSVLCFRQQADWIVPFGASGTPVDTRLPSNACRQFGPDVPDGKPGEPAGRPADPDTTGGYYQPVRLLLPEGDAWVLSLGQTRITCGLPGATLEALLDYQARHRTNANPALSAVQLVADDGSTQDLEGASPPAVAAGSRVTLRASWPTCPAVDACGDGICGMSETAKACPADCKTPHGCAGAETYVVYDLATRTNLTQREGMRVAWYAAAGTFDLDRSGRDRDDPGTSADDVWTAPTAPGVVPLWLVLRDDRGGVDFRAVRVAVR